MGVIICGLNGTGKSTLGKVLAEKLNFYFIDIEDLYFPKTDPNYIYTSPRTRKEVERLLLQEVKTHKNFVLASVKGDYGEDIYSFILECKSHIIFGVDCDKIHQADPQIDLEFIYQFVLCLCGKGFFVKLFKSHYFSTFGFENFLWDIFCRAFAAFLFLCTAAVCGIFFAFLGGYTFEPSATSIPHITLPTVSAFDFACEAGSVNAPVGENTKLSAAGFFVLHRLVNIHWDNSFMSILNEILRKFTTVFSAFLCDGVNRIFLLEQQVSCVGDVAKNLADRGVAEVLTFIRLSTPFNDCFFITPQALHRSGQSQQSATIEHRKRDFRR